MTFTQYTGAGGLYRRTAFAFAFTAGMKVLGLPVEQRPFKNCYQCRGNSCRKCGGKGKTRMAGGVWLNTRLFAKKFRSDRKVGQSIQDAVRPLAVEFEDFNGVLERDEAVLAGAGGSYDPKNPPPTGSGVLLASLAASHPNGADDGSSPPGWNQHLRAHKLGRHGGFGATRDAGLEDGREGVDRDKNPEPNGGAECRGDGDRATRWMNGRDGWDHYDIPCPASDCIFAPVCKVRTTINLMTPHGLGQYQSNGRETGAGALDFFGTLANPGRVLREAAELGIPSLYGLPVRLTIATKTKGAGTVAFGKHRYQVQARRFPVVDVVEAMPLPEFAHHQQQMLAGRTQIALPPAPEERDLTEADRDLVVEHATETTAARPGTEAGVDDVQQKAGSSRPIDPGGEPATAEASSPRPAGLSTSDKIGAWMEENGYIFNKRAVTRALGEAGLIQRRQFWYDCEAPWAEVKKALDGLGETS